MGEVGGEAIKRASAREVERYCAGAGARARARERRNSARNEMVNQMGVGYRAPRGLSDCQPPRRPAPSPPSHAVWFGSDMMDHR